jgi:hypothetical protein
VSWIEDAKASGYKKRRLEAVQQKLLEGKKTLSKNKQEIYKLKTLSS